MEGRPVFRRLVVPATFVLAACGGAALAPSGQTRSAADATELSDAARGASVARGELPECGAGASAPLASRSSAVAAEPGGMGREAAQRGLAFLARDTVAWQQQHNCYGCHVQAVTLDAMIVGRRNHYQVDEESFREVLRGMLDIPGGARGPAGFSVQNSPTHLIESSKAFGGAALAEYDEHVGAELADELLEVADALLAYQDDDGSVRSTDHRPPVVAGLMQSTTQAARTWRQAYARSADDRWLLPISRAEEYIRTRAGQLTDENETYLQDVSYAIIGLLAAGAGSSEDLVELLAGELRERQNADGGWGFRPGEPSDAFATGQALYVLRRLGTGDSDPSVERGTGWLVEAQQPGGGWSTGGDRRGEAMWAVLGLVSIDVLSVTTEGLVDGTHAAGSVPLVVRASDPEGRPARSIELRVDDVPVHRTCSGQLSFEVAADALEAGTHRLDVIATDAEGKASRRRLTFYTGDHYLTRVGTRYREGATELSLRNVAPASTGGRVRLRVYRAGEGGAERGERLWATTEEATQGAMTFSWDGRTEGGEAAPRGRYLAEVAFLDRRGNERHVVSTPFVHDTDEAQRNQYGQVAGRVDFDEADVSGASIELVDDEGRVVQRTTSTRNGQYRFRNVDRGRYRVRIRRRGFRAAEAEVQAAPAANSAADLSLEAH